MIKILAVLSVLCLSACGWRHPSPAVELIAPIKEKTIALYEVSDIRVEGVFNVKLATGPHSAMTIIAPPPILSKIKIRSSQHRMLLTYHLSRKQLVIPTLIITTPTLHNFIYRGKGRIEANLYAPALNVAIDNPMQSVFKGHLGLQHVVISGGGTARFSGVNSHYLDLTVRQASTVIMQGTMHLGRLDMKHNGRLYLNRIVANHLRIRAHGKTFFQLAGHINQLDMTLREQATFKGRGLSVKNSFVTTYDKAFVELVTVGNQHTVAHDNSEIICYHLPITETDFMVDDGTVLNLHPYPYE